MSAGSPRVDFALVDSEVAWRGNIVSVGRERFRFSDGEEVLREKVWHPGAVGILAVEPGRVWLTRQPREVVGLAGSLEIPAGKRDVDGEPPLQTARRELAEEVGKQAEHWSEVSVFFSSPGFTDERVWLYLATGLSDSPPAAQDDDERIEIVPWPLEQLDAAIVESVDSKSLLALAWLQVRLARGELGLG